MLCVGELSWYLEAHPELNYRFLIAIPHKKIFSTYNHKNIFSCLIYQIKSTQLPKAKQNFKKGR
jgi:hypothetical protein